MASERTETGVVPDPDMLARVWLVRLKSGEASQQDLDLLADWRSQDGQNEAAFRRAVQLWNGLGPALAGGMSPVPGLAAPLATGVSRRWVLGGASGLAAAAAVTLFVGGTAAPAGAAVFETAKGERQNLQLERQVMVVLNTDSRLFYWADALSPRVTLDRGEAIVSASCEGGRRLIARVREIEVEAQTAHFLLRSEGDDVSVACIDGRLTVRSGGTEHVLTGGMKADFHEDKPDTVDTPVTENDLSWQSGLLQFNDRPAGEVIAELNRYRPGHVYLQGEMAHVRISGLIDLDRADLAVDHIARSLDMKVTRLPGGIVILRGS